MFNRKDQGKNQRKNQRKDIYEMDWSGFEENDIFEGPELEDVDLDNFLKNIAKKIEENDFITEDRSAYENPQQDDMDSNSKILARYFAVSGLKAIFLS